MTDTPQLRDRIADALTAWAERHGLQGTPTVVANAYSRADAVLAVVQPELDQARAAGMRESAAMLRRYCPDHGTEDTCLMDCHCAGADEIDRDARKIAPPAPTT